MLKVKFVTAAVIAAFADRQIEAQGDGVSEGQFDLAVVAARAKDPQVRDHPVPRTDDRHRLFRSEMSRLIKRPQRAKLVAPAEQPLERVLADVAVAGADIHHQRIRRCPISRERFAETLINRLAYQVFNHGSVRQWTYCNHSSSILTYYDV